MRLWSKLPTMFVKILIHVPRGTFKVLWKKEEMITLVVEALTMEVLVMKPISSL